MPQGGIITARRALLRSVRSRASLCHRVAS
jgi:hypothetical protein